MSVTLLIFYANGATKVVANSATQVDLEQTASRVVVPLRHLRHMPPQTVWRLWLIVCRTELKVSLWEYTISTKFAGYTACSSFTNKRV